MVRGPPRAGQIPFSDVKLAAVGGDRDRFTALLGGVVDAAVVSRIHALPSSRT